MKPLEKMSKRSKIGVAMGVVGKYVIAIRAKERGWFEKKAMEIVRK